MSHDFVGFFVCNTEKRLVGFFVCNTEKRIETYLCPEKLLQSYEK